MSEVSVSTADTQGWQYLACNPWNDKAIIDGRNWNLVWNARKKDDERIRPKLTTKSVNQSIDPLNTQSTVSNKGILTPQMAFLFGLIQWLPQRSALDSSSSTPRRRWRFAIIQRYWNTKNRKKENITNATTGAMNQPLNCIIHQSITQLTGQSINRSIKQSIDWPNRPINWTITIASNEKHSYKHSPMHQNAPSLFPVLVNKFAGFIEITNNIKLLTIVDVDEFIRKKQVSELPG